MNVWFCVFSILTCGIAFVLFFRQNRPGKIGGPIAPSKAIWLHYTLYTWFCFLPYALFQYGEIPRGDLYVWWILAGSMWARGLVELYMLFVSKNWTPVIGISHDVVTVIGMAIGYALGDRAGRTEQPGVFVFTWSLFASLIVEIHHAASFFKLMQGRTQGDDGLWYAHKGDPKFLRILRVTAACNVVLYAALIFFICTWATRDGG